MDVRNEKPRVRVLPHVTAATLGLILGWSALAQSAAPGASDGGTGQTQQAATPPPQVTVIQLFFKGGFFMYPLALCSVIAVGLILERFLALRKSRVIPPGFIPGLKGVLTDLRADRDAALAYCRKHDSPIARVLAAGIKRLPRGWQAAEKAIEDEGANQALRLRHNMRFLYALGSVGTLLGLIGTISGMIKAFQVAAVAGVGRVDQLSTGIYEAMTCTFAGLAVAIVVTTFYYFFIGRIERLLVEMTDTVNRFADDYGIGEAAVVGDGAAARPDTERQPFAVA
jgi:biopolymer transport protein ExbB